MDPESSSIVPVLRSFDCVEAELVRKARIWSEIQARVGGEVQGTWLRTWRVRGLAIHCYRSLRSLTAATHCGHSLRGISQLRGASTCNCEAFQLMRTASAKMAPR